MMQPWSMGILVSRGGWDDLRQAIDARPVAEASLAVGVALFD